MFSSGLRIRSSAGIQRRRFAAAGRTGDQDQPVRPIEHLLERLQRRRCGSRGLPSARCRFALSRIRITSFSPSSVGMRADAQVDLATLGDDANAAFLRQALLGDVHLADDLHARHDRRVHARAAASSGRAARRRCDSGCACPSCPARCECRWPCRGSRVSSVTLTRLMIGLPATILSRSVVGPSSIVSRSTTSTSLSDSDVRNASTLTLPPAYFLMNSWMFARARAPDESCSRSAGAADRLSAAICGSAIATVSVSRTLNIGMHLSRSASSSPISLKSDGSIRP